MKKEKFVPIRYLVTLWVCLISLSPIQAQLVGPVFRNYTVKDGLGSAGIRALMEDEQGYIWISNFEGIDKFDGQHFSQKLIHRSSIFDLIQTPDKKIWIHSGRYIGYLKDKEFIGRPFCDKICALTKGSMLLSFLIDSAGSIWFTVANNDITNDPFKRFTTLYQLTQDTVITHDLASDPEAHRLGKYSYWKLIEGKPIYTGRYKRSHIEPKKKQVLGPQVFDPDVFDYYINEMIRLRDGTFLASTGHTLIHFDTDTIYFYGAHYLPPGHLITNLYEDQSGGIWLSTMGGVFHVQHQNFLDTTGYQHFLKDYTITQTIQSQDGSYWIGTHEGGIFQISSLTTKWLRFPNEKRKSRFYSMIVEEDSIWISSYDGNIYVMDSSLNMVRLPVPSQKKIPLLYRYEGQVLTTTRWLISSKGSQSLGILKGEDSKAPISFNYLVISKNGIVWAASNSGGLFAIDLEDRSLLFNSRRIGFHSKVDDLEVDSSGVLWFTAEGNIWTFQDSTFSHPYQEFPELEKLDKKWGLYGIRFLDSQTLLVRDTDSRYAVIYPDKVQLLRPDIEIRESGYLTASVESSDAFWIFSQHSFSRFSRDSISQTYKITASFNLGFFIPQDAEYVSAEYVDGQIWVYTTNGLVIIDPQSVLDQQAHFPPVYITGLEANGLFHPSDQSIELPYFENRVILNYQVISYQDQARIQSRYRLLGTDEPWQYTTDSRIRYTNLDPGRYTFEVESSNGNGEFRNETQKLQFEIRPHITQTMWFRVLASLLVIGLILSGMYAYIRYNTQQNQQRRIITELRYQSLINQMNPHFIFNAMNSIAFMIRNQENRKANRYLAQFAGLLRGVLENAHDSFISLEEEMTQIQQYVALEQLQLGEELEQDIDIDPDLDLANLYVPPMLLQPFIENAIKHGIAPNGGGELWIHVLDAEDRILIAIRDDGIGREASTHLKKSYISKKGRSVGLSNSQERIDTLNRLYQIEISMHIEDLRDGDQAIGTQVEFSFPKLTHIPRISFVSPSIQN